MNTKKLLLATTLFFSSLISFGQNVGINETGVAGDPSAGLDVDFDDKGLLVPRVALSQTTNAAPVVAPANSLLVFNTATVNDVTPGYYYWFGGQWVRIGSGSGDDWLLAGNAGTNPNNDFLGTTDNQALVFRTNNLERARFQNNGLFGVANNNPQGQVHISLNNINNEPVIIDKANGGGSGPLMDWYGFSTTHRLQLQYVSSDYELNTTLGRAIRFAPDQTQTMIIEDMQVGIGTVGISAGAVLDVRSGDFLFNEAAEDIDVRMETLNNDYAFYLDASKDVLFVGDNFGDYQNGNTVDGEVVDYVANFDNGGISGTAIGIGSIEYLLDRSGETTINNRFSPSTDGGEDLGGTARRWAEVFAQNGTINTSDRRDKKDIENLNYGLKELMQLKPVSFNWKDHLSSPDQAGVKKLGLIAQDLHEIIPEVVKTKDYVKIGENPDTDEPIKEVQEAKRWGVFYSDLIPVLIKGIQEQQEIIDEQEETIDDLEGKYQELKNEIELIKKQLE